MPADARSGKLRAGAAWTVGLLALYFPVVLCLKRSLAVDEYIYLHWAYEASRGVFAGTDFFATHFPFMQVLFAPVFWIEHAQPERGAVVARVLFALMATGSICLAFFDYARVKGVTGTGVATLRLPVVAVAAASAASFDAYANRLIEIRPDNVYIFFVLLSVLLFPPAPPAPPAPHRVRSWLSGASFGCALLSSEKMSVVVVPMVIAHAVAVVVSRTAREATKKRVLGPEGRGFAIGLVGFLVLGVLVGCGGNVRGFVEQMTALWIYLQGRFAEAVPFMERPGAEGYVEVLKACGASLVVVTVFAVFRVWKRDGDAAPRPSFRWSPTYLALLAAGGLTYGIQRAPFEYSRNLFFVVAVPLVVDAVALVIQATRLPALLVMAAQAALWVAVVLHSRELLATQNPTLEANLAMLGDLRKITTADDCVYDNSAAAYFRDHAHKHYVMTDWLMRAEQGKQLSEQIPPAILGRGCVAMMVDFRNGGMPPSLKTFLDTHYVLVSPYFYLYSTLLVTKPGVEDELAEPTDFFAPQPSWYAAVGPSGATVRVSTDAPWTDRVWLERGNHKVFVSHPGTRLMWQPRDGSSKLPYRGRPDFRFSHI